MGVSAFATYQSEHWDDLADFDIWEGRTLEGHYICELCEEPEFFASREELWEKHCFEPFLAWVDEHFNESQWLLFFDYGGAAEAQLKESAEGQFTGSEEHLVHECPILIKNNCP